MGSTYPPLKLGSEIGRNNSCQPKEVVAKLSEEASGRKVSDLELMELRIREKIGNEYGGLARTNWAAIVIQTAYRQYQLKKQYDVIRKKISMLRKLGREIIPRRSRRRHVVDQKWIEPPLSSSSETSAEIKENKSGPVVSIIL